MAKQIYAKGVTPIGTAMWSHLKSTEQFQGKDTNRYSLSLVLAPDDEKALLDKIDAEWQKFKETEEGQKHKYKYDPSNGFKEGEGDRDNLFKFKMTASVKTKRGTMWERHVPVYDAGCKEISNDIDELGNGSRVKVAYELVPFYMNDKNYGISLRLTAVQVIEFKDSNETAESFGFGQEEGFHKEDSEEIEVPFDASGGEEDF